MKESGISLSEYDYFDNGTPWHYHENPYFMYVINGNMEDINKAGSTALSPGSLMFLNWQDPHSTLKKSKIGRGFHLQITRDWLTSSDLSQKIWEGSQVLQAPQIHIILGKIYHEFRTNDKYSGLSIELLTSQLCSLLSLQEDIEKINPPSWLHLLIDLLHNSKEELSLKYLSKELGVTPVHISRTIPKYLNTTLGAYLRKIKVQRALPLLLDKSFSLGQIAFECGFSDQSHFTRTFKSFYNCTPRTFRNSSNNYLS